MASYSNVSQSSRNHFREPLPLTQRIMNSLYHDYIRRLLRGPAGTESSSPPSHQLPYQHRKALRRWPIRRLFSLTSFLTLSWILLLWWGERLVFTNHVDSCRWDRWEQWPVESTPHRLLLVADPQLVDPHTYPGRPWPLSTMTVKHTDIYLWRAFKSMLQALHPDTLFFLGDLFDGGREWTGQGRGTSSEDQWRSYGDAYWLREYARFNRIFFDLWSREGGQISTEPRGRKIIASLPGNHDLGLGTGIQLPVRDRFGAYFGDGNRVDVIANHTFLSVDTVSLSAVDQQQPNAAGKTGAEAEENTETREKVWKPVRAFLDELPSSKRRAVEAELSYQRGQQSSHKLEHEAVEAKSAGPSKEFASKEGDNLDLPTVLLTHVPLYRLPGTPCGPLRERWPPSKMTSSSPTEKDERNAIPVRAGYQYQNVLTPEVSKELVEKVGNVAHVFSGDDHDYCEVFHKGYTSSSNGGASAVLGGLKEITVKSISWAMGVRRPGFVMLSLWNPLDSSGHPANLPGSASRDSASAATMQSHLCLLPDQLGIFTRYGLLGFATLVILGMRAFLVSSGRLRSSNDGSNSSQSLLPLSKSSSVSYSSAEVEKSIELDGKAHSPPPPPHVGNLSDSSQSSISSNRSQARGLAARNANARTRSASPTSNGYALPLVNHAKNADVYHNHTHRLSSATDDLGRDKRPSLPRPFLLEFARSFWRVAWVVLLWYFWLLKRG